MSKAYQQLKALETRMAALGNATVKRARLLQDVTIEFAESDLKTVYEAIPSGWFIRDSGFVVGKAGVRFIHLEREVPKE